MLTQVQDQQLSSALYPRLLGPAWHSLREVVRRHHLQGQILRATGSFRIRHGDGRAARVLARLLRLPPEAEAVNTQLVIRACGDGEEWHRTFGSHLMLTRQSAAARRELDERFGMMGLRFRLEVVDGGLVYHQLRAALFLGRLRIPLPHWLAPRVRAWESPADSPDQVHVAVEVVVPLLGRLISYEGAIAREEPAS